MQIPHPFTRTYYAIAYELFQLSEALGLGINIADIQRAVRICKSRQQYFFRLGGACFDMGIGFQKAAIRCDIGTFAGCSIELD